MLWFLIPTQLLIHGQWWSYLSTHLWQIMQCLDLAVRIVLHSGHKDDGSNVSNKFMKSTESFIKYPGSIFIRIMWINNVRASDVKAM